MIKLIITADDCGLSEGINASTARLHERGLLSAASIMPNFGNLQHAFDTFAAYPALELGVHLNLTDGRPLTGAALRSELTRSSGVFRNQFFLYPQALFPSDDLIAAIRAELSMQMETCLSYGRPITHVTTHHHFHLFPALREIVYQLSNDYDVVWVRNSDYRLSVLPFNPVIDKSPQMDTPHNFIVPDFIILVKVWQDLPPEMLLEELLSLHGVVELVVHPSTRDDATYPSEVRYTPSERYQEAQYLERLGKLMEPHLGNGIHITNFLEAHSA